MKEVKSEHDKAYEKNLRSVWTKKEYKLECDRCNEILITDEFKKFLEFARKHHAHPWGVR